MADRANAVDRILAVVLVAGGVWGAVAGIYGQGRILYRSSPAVLRTHWIAFVPMELFLGLFAWSAIVGLRFWRHETRAWKWVVALFAIQIPIVTFPGLRYWYYTGIAARLVFVRITNSVSVGFFFGAGGAMWLGAGIPDLMYGVNLFACFALMYLIMRRSAYKRVPGPASVAERPAA